MQANLSPLANGELPTPSSRLGPGCFSERHLSQPRSFSTSMLLHDRAPGGREGGESNASLTTAAASATPRAACQLCCHRLQGTPPPTGSQGERAAARLGSGRDSKCPDGREQAVYPMAVRQYLYLWLLRSGLGANGRRGNALVPWRGVRNGGRNTALRQSNKEESPHLGPP